MAEGQFSRNFKALIKFLANIPDILVKMDLTTIKMFMTVDIIVPDITDISVVTLLS